MAMDNETTLKVVQALIELGFVFNTASDYIDGLKLGYECSLNDDVIIDIDPEFIDYCVKQVVQIKGE